MELIPATPRTQLSVLDDFEGGPEVVGVHVDVPHAQRWLHQLGRPHAGRHLPFTNTRTNKDQN